LQIITIEIGFSCIYLAIELPFFLQPILIDSS
jgi:hypothetical protein